MTAEQATRQQIHDRYWAIANNPEERGYVQVRALDSLCRMLDLFPRGQQPNGIPEPPLPDFDDPDVLVCLMSDEQIDRLMAMERAEAKRRLEAEANAEAEAEQDEEDDESSNPDEDEPP